ncbi:hypothetical protein Peur_067143 [Populus x canadensis]|jgi:hypothetical protein
MKPESGGSIPTSQKNKSVSRIPVPFKQRDSRSYAMVVRAGNDAVQEPKNNSGTVPLVIHNPSGGGGCLDEE